MNSTFASLEAPATYASSHSFQIRKILLAHDGSIPATQALSDAATLARRFGSEIVVAHVQSPEEASPDDLSQARPAKRAATEELSEIANGLTKAGLRSRTMLRMGAVGDALMNVCLEEGIDLLMFGAYGCGRCDLHRLGSTAEHLLSALPCPAVVYGPGVRFSLAGGLPNRPVVFAVSFPLHHRYVRKGIEIAKYFQASAEVVLATEPTAKDSMVAQENDCKHIASVFEGAGVRSSYFVHRGNPTEIILKRCVKLDSQFILLPVKYHHVMAPDNVVANVIRASQVPVLTYSMR